MPITSIQRDTNNNVSLVRMISTDSIATIQSSNYIAKQQNNINNLNGGEFAWFVTDMIMCSASNGNAFFYFVDKTFSTLSIYGEQGGGTINPGLIGQIAYYYENGTSLSGLTILANSVLTYDNTGTPIFSQTLPSTVQRNITALGTIATGVWQASIIGVPYGGTGADSFTAYGVICGGTTSSGNLQSVADVGTAGYLLTSNGPGALPTFQNGVASGIINTGGINDIAYYSTNPTGKTLSSINTGNDGVLITSGLGVPSISSTLPSTVQGNITALGTIATGVWQASIIGGTYGGTGVNNGASTITIGGNVTFLGAHTFAGTLTADTAVTFPTSGTLATTAGTVTNATNAANVATTQTSTNASYYPLFVASSTNGNQACDLGTGLTFNPSSNTLTTTTFAGALSGNATTATTATNATNVATTATNSTNATFYPTFVAAATSSNQGVDTATGLTFNPSTNTLTTTAFSGALTGNVTGNVSGSSGSCTGNAATASAVAVGGITGLGTGVATALAANVNGTGAISLTTSPTFVTPNIGDANAQTLMMHSNGGPIYSADGYTALGIYNGGGISVNFWGIAGAVTGLGCILQAFGSDTNVIGILNGKGTGGVTIHGTGTNDNASAGYVGEFVSSQILFASATFYLILHLFQNMTSISLTAGDWDVYANVYFNPSTTNVSSCIAAINTTSATLPDNSLLSQNGINGASEGALGLVVLPQRISIGTTTTVYVIGRHICYWVLYSLWRHLCKTSTLINLKY